MYDPQEQHPMIGRLFAVEPYEETVNDIDLPERLYELERRHYAANYIREWLLQPGLSELEQALAPLYAPMHTVDHMNNQFADRVVDSVLTDDFEDALRLFRGLHANTVDEELVLLINDDQLDSMFHGLQKSLIEGEQEIRNCVAESQKRIEEADRYQFSGKAARSLEKVRKSGFEMMVMPERLEDVRAANLVAGIGIIPVTEYLKNERLLVVNSFDTSKISLAVHDNIDHIWMFDMLERLGLLDRYSEMFSSVGNPEATDIFKREGEMVASIAYGVRYYHAMPSGFGPAMRASQIETVMDKLFVDGELEPKHMNAYRTLKQYRKGSMEWQSLGFAFSNYLSELKVGQFLLNKGESTGAIIGY